jgi:hypothetical protein
VVIDVIFIAVFIFMGFPLALFLLSLLSKTPNKELKLMGKTILKTGNLF